MVINTLSEISEKPRKADKSAPTSVRVMLFSSIMMYTEISVILLKAITCFYNVTTCFTWKDVDRDAEGVALLGRKTMLVVQLRRRENHR